MTANTLERAQIFAHFTGKSILYVEELFNKESYWFVAYDFIPANPSNHIHQNSMRNGQCINSMMNIPTDFDEVMFLTKLTEIPKSSITFDMNHKWLLIN
jgi:hypothetical protein